MTKSFKNAYDTIDEKTIDIDVANAFIILSAYFITKAITKPPNAAKNIIKTTNPVIPCSHPFSNISFKSKNNAFRNANIIP